MKINKEMKNLKNTYSLFNNPSLLGADKVWYNFNITIEPQRKPTHFSRWMNLVDNFV